MGIYDTPGYVNNLLFAVKGIEQSSLNAKF